MKVELNKKVVEVLESATLTLDKREVRMLLDLMGNIGGEGEMRDFINNLYGKLEGPSKYLKDTNPFFETPHLDCNYKPKGF